VGQPFAGVCVGCRDDSLAGAHGIRERARHDLIEVRVWRDEDVGSLEPGPEFDSTDETIDELDMVGHTESCCLGLEAPTVRLALTVEQVRVCRAEDHVGH